MKGQIANVLSSATYSPVGSSFLDFFSLVSVRCSAVLPAQHSVDTDTLDHSLPFPCLQHPLLFVLLVVDLFISIY